MKKIVPIFIACSFLLVGCWDEQLYKEVSIVPLVGIERESEKFTGHYSFSVISNESISFSTVEGNGLSVRDTRLNANSKASETLDLSQLQVMLLTEETAKLNINQTFDAIFRTPRTRLSSRVAIVEGDITPYIEKTENMDIELPDFYKDILKTDIEFSVLPDIDIQNVAGIINDDAIDLALPFIKMDEKTGIPKISGLALFSDKAYTGRTLDKEESIIVQVLQKKPGKYSMFTYIWKKEGEPYPLTVELARYKKKWDIQDGKINATYKMKFNIEEFPYDHLDNEKNRKEIEGFLSKELTKDFNKVTKKLQEAKSDAVGFGRSVRAFHPRLWNKGNWHDTFSELEINVKVEAEISRTGILN
ncbi:Ger(x)C family spore germination protein [Sporosarcina sp. JAI121]|uniref:Ger(x)C family spore germination protein n=1 Tax=Sporosarcina sp. JAI121 TaxID=2723064 RepID=UPI0015C79E09|nr:Ger(x)C family spore germination protein [Sporosarcina sp. JAI121]NYF24721.1 Ger(x)C family germination protein [Sporosarcina sp. JAI121]